LTASDSWSFTLSQDTLSQIDLTAIVPRTRVQISINDVVQSQGILDDVRVKSDRSGGTVVTLAGRNWISPAIDSHCDPNLRLKESQTLLDALQAILGPFGVTVFAADNTANRNAITGRVYGVKTTKTGKPIKSYVNHELKPYQQEGAWQFAERVAQKHGLCLWAANDGQTVIVGKPDYEQEARYQIRHLTSDPSQNNVIESDVTISGQDQPTVILACGPGSGGDFANSTLRSAIVNPIIQADYGAIVAAYPSVKFVPVPAEIIPFEPMTDPGARPLFVYDAESNDQNELDNFVLRELSMLVRKSLTAHYTIMGHQLAGQNVAVDTIVDVEDDRSGLHMPLWIISRSFRKSANAGTTTTIEAIRVGSFQV
jgi:prophage tail gpP-like protein